MREGPLQVPAVAVAFVMIGILLPPAVTGRQPRTDPEAAGVKPIAQGGGEIGLLLRGWYAEGTAAGNSGDYYDNRDGGHSLLDMASYPQLRKIEYGEDEIRQRLHWGTQSRILPQVVFGNSSTSAAPEQGGSNARAYYADPRGLEFLFAQYVRNNLYIYPEHQDHDPGRNGAGGYGDLLPTNTPYLIACQGSSGSDQPFMRALPYVLAAFRPEVKKRLVESGLLMPTVQMILRITNRSLSGEGDYLTGKAHPTVFRGSDVDALAMVRMAHRILPSDIPPVALIRVIEEETPVRGIDHFEPELTESLADTPAVVARVFRGKNGTRTMAVSAERSRDPNGRPLQFHWAVLRGDADRIRIAYRNAARSVAEITVPYHGRRPVEEGSPLESCRVDIGVFAHNGRYYSPPAFVTFHALDDEARTYGPGHLPFDIGYGAGTSTLTVRDWGALYDALALPPDSWPRAFLRGRFRPEELSALAGAAGRFHDVHQARLKAEQNREEAAAAEASAAAAVRELKARSSAAAKHSEPMPGPEGGALPGEPARELAEAVALQEERAAQAAAARKALQSAQASENGFLEAKLPALGVGVAQLVEGRLEALLRDPDLWGENAEAIAPLAASSGREAGDALRQVQQTLADFGVAEIHDGTSFRLKFLRDGKCTRFEKTLVERLNTVLLSRIVFPGMLRGEWRENYVDPRISTIKGWRDVYRYEPDGALSGWLRYQPGGVLEFNAEGLLVLDADRDGRCVRARVVRYEVEPAPGVGARGAVRGRVKLVSTDIVLDY